MVLSDDMYQSYSALRKILTLKDDKMADALQKLETEITRCEYIIGARYCLIRFYCDLLRLPERWALVSLQIMYALNKWINLAEDENPDYFINACLDLILILVASRLIDGKLVAELLGSMNLGTLRAHSKLVHIIKHMDREAMRNTFTSIINGLCRHRNVYEFMSLLVQDSEQTDFAFIDTDRSDLALAKIILLSIASSVLEYDANWLGSFTFDTDFIPVMYEIGLVDQDELYKCLNLLIERCEYMNRPFVFDVFQHMIERCGESASLFSQIHLDRNPSGVSFLLRVIKLAEREHVQLDRSFLTCLEGHLDEADDSYGFNPSSLINTIHMSLI